MFVAKFVNNLEFVRSKLCLLSMEFGFLIEVIKHPLKSRMVCYQLEFSLDKVRLAFSNAPVGNKGFTFSSTVSSLSLVQSLIEEFDNSFFAIFIQLSKNSTDCIVRGVSGQDKKFIVIRSGKNWFFDDLLLEIFKGVLSSSGPFELRILSASCYVC